MKKHILFILFFTSTRLGISQEVIYFSSRQSPPGTGTWQIYMKNLTTLATTTITNSQTYNYWWVEPSPDRSQLLMLRSPYVGPSDEFYYVKCELVKSNANGSNQRVIISTNQYGWQIFGSPHWHSAGNRIVLSALDTTMAQTTNRICVVDTSGNNPTFLTSQFSIDPNWSSDGSKIVFIGINTAGYVNETSSEVFSTAYDYASNTISGITQLTSDSTRDQYPCFSPDDSKIVFLAGDQVTNADLVTIEANRNNRTPIVDDSGVHGGPLNWGEDGKIYHHTNFFGYSTFMANDFNTNNNSYDTLLASPSYAYRCPYYVNLNTVGIKTIAGEAANIIIFPNPMSRETTISCSQNWKDVTISLFDVSGNCLMSHEYTSGNSIVLNRNGLSNGLYFLQLMRQDKIVFVSKLVVQD